MRQGLRAHALAAVAATFLTIGLLGCNSSREPEPPPVGAKGAGQTAGGQLGGAPTLESLKTELLAGKAQIDATLGALAKVTDPATTDVRGAYNTYADQVARTTHHNETLKREAVAMRDSRNEYFARWENRMMDVDNPTIRASVEAKRNKLRASHERIVTASHQARDAYDPLMKDLQDVKKFMASDPSKANAALVVDVQKNAVANGATVKSKIDTIVAELDAIMAAQ